MTDAQLMTLALAIIIPLSMLIYSNSRITEAKETLRAEIKALQAEIQTGFTRVAADIKGLAADIKALDFKLDTKLTIHELEHHK